MPGDRRGARQLTPALPRRRLARRRAAAGEGAALPRVQAPAAHQGETGPEAHSLLKPARLRPD